MVSGRPVTALLLILLATIYFGLGINPAKRPVLENSLPSGNARVQEDLVIQNAFEDNDFAALALRCEGGESCVASRRYLEAVRALSELAEGSSIIATATSVIKDTK